jgi:4'-phosphopantetheinyl transferase EntD
LTDPAPLEQLLVRLTPDGTGVAACRSEPCLLEQLSAEERDLVASARTPRRVEFAAGRACAHRALAAIGADARTIGRGDRRQPVWPAGVTGSISHAAGLAAAVATRSSESVTGIGLDVELAEPLADDLWAVVLTPTERTTCEAADEQGVAAMAIFGAKEAAFKAVYPMVGVEIDFLEATCELAAGSGTVELPSVGASVVISHGRAGPFLVSVAVVATVA